MIKALHIADATVTTVYLPAASSERLAALRARLDCQSINVLPLDGGVDVWFADTPYSRRTGNRFATRLARKMGQPLAVVRGDAVVYGVDGEDDAVSLTGEQVRDLTALITSEPVDARVEVGPEVNAAIEAPVDLSVEVGYTVPVHVARTVWADCVEWCQEHEVFTGAVQDEAGRWWDLLYMSHLAARPTRAPVPFRVARISPTAGLDPDTDDVEVGEVELTVTNHGDRVVIDWPSRR